MEPAARAPHEPAGAPPAGAAAAQHTGLLVVEAFAGSYPVAWYFRNQLARDAAHRPDLYLAAYAAVENKHFDKAPTASELGLGPSSYLSIDGDMAAFDVQSKVLDFVQKKLHDESLGVDDVVVFGGPPCVAYSQAATQLKKQKKKQGDSGEAYQEALRQLAEQNRMLLSTHSTEQTERVQAAREQAAAAALARDQAIRQAALTSAMRSDDLMESDCLIKSFLNLVKEIKVGHVVSFTA